MRGTQTTADAVRYPLDKSHKVILCGGPGYPAKLLLRFSLVAPAAPFTGAALIPWACESASRASPLGQLDLDINTCCKVELH
jgi:hypothetical protein